MVIHNCIQKSDAWMKLRAGIPTTSEFSRFMKADFTARSGEGFNSYIAQKVAEKWLGGPLPQSFSSFDQEQGTILEDEAIPAYEFEHKCDIQRVGFITTDNLRAGCSPDGLLDDAAGYAEMVSKFSNGEAEYKCASARCGIEIKCPKIETHVGYLLSGKLPADYAAQVHGAMYVTGAAEWKFMSYRRNFPQFILTVERNEEIQTQIDESITEFWESFDNAYAHLIAINGGKR